MSDVTTKSWGIERTDTNLWVGPMRPDGRKVTEIVAVFDIGNGYTAESNARQQDCAALISAAPDMLEALINLRKLITANDTDGRVVPFASPEMMAMQAAISKATLTRKEDE